MKGEGTPRCRALGHHSHFAFNVRSHPTSTASAHNIHPQSSPLRAILELVALSFRPEHTECRCARLPACSTHRRLGRPPTAAHVMALISPAAQRPGDPPRHPHPATVQLFLVHEHRAFTADLPLLLHLSSCVPTLSISSGIQRTLSPRIQSPSREQRPLLSIDVLLPCLSRILLVSSKAQCILIRGPSFPLPASRLPNLLARYLRTQRHAIK